MKDGIKLSAPAKLNVTLEVVKKRPDGYHDIRSVLVRLDRLADTIDLQVAAGESGIRIVTNSRDIPADERNICHQAVTRYLHTIREAARVELHIDKRIPIAAGLGGGSSDAASVLLALNALFKNRLQPRELQQLGSAIGRDIPFFLRGDRCSRASGTGEIMQRLPSLPSIRFLLINPGITISTAEAYAGLDEKLWLMASDRRANRTDAMAKAIRADDAGKIAACLYNDFELLIEPMHPIVKELKQALLAFGALGALMSGSGPTVFGLFNSRAALIRAEEALRKHYPSFFFAST